MHEKIKNYPRLRQMLTLGFFICGITPIILIALVSTLNVRQLAINDIETTAKQVVEHRADVINTFLQSQVGFLNSLSKLYTLDTLKDKENFKKLFLAVSKSESEGEIIDLQLINTSGDQLAYVGPYAEKIQGKVYRDAPWFTQVLSRGTYVSDVFTGFRDFPHFVVALTDPLKTYILRATINSAIFNSLLHSAQIGGGGDAFIVNNRGEFQTPSLQNHEKLNETEMEMLKYHSGTEIFDDGEFIYSGRWLNGNMWLLVIRTRISDSLEGYYNYRNRILLLISLAVIVFFFVATGFSQAIISRLQKFDHEQTVADQQMAHIEKMANIGRLAAGIAHEINNPLQLIQMQAGWIEELLKEEKKEDVVNFDEYLGAVAKIKQHISRAGAITHRLLGFSRKISNEYNVHINELIDETLSFLQSDVESNSINMNLQLDDSITAIRADGAQLQQALLNIIENALDAVEPGGQIDIKTSKTQKEVCIEIGDSGPGINPEILQKIWEPFFTTKEAGKGTGLGLSICNDIIHKLGGSLTVANKPEGGALFTIKLPKRV